MRTAAHLISVLLALVLIGCTSTTTAPLTPTVVTPPTPTPPGDTSLDIAAELAANYTRWNEAGIRDYRFALMVGCYCPMYAMMPITVEVRDGAVVTLTDANGVVVALDDPGAGFFMKYTTIDGIYAELTSARFGEADKLTITFDSSYPVPATISADFIEMAVDDELYMGISGFTVISE
ncbi:MAG: hypothetical protein FJ040_01930 [Chloroflexi bacterium]|nr:hypothetical protein [Chloroflexota bacterium]